MATIYGNAGGSVSVTTDWDDPLNWYTDSGCTTSYGSIPQANDDVNIVGSTALTTGPAATITLTSLNTSGCTANLTMTVLNANITVATVTLGVSGNNSVVHTARLNITGSYTGQGGSDYRINGDTSMSNISLADAAKIGPYNGGGGGSLTLTLGGSIGNTGSAVTIETHSMSLGIICTSASFTGTIDSSSGGSVYFSAPGHDMDLNFVAGTALIGDMTSGGGCANLTLTNYSTASNVPYHGTVTGNITCTNCSLTGTTTCTGAFGATGTGTYSDITAQSITIGSGNSTSGTHTTTSGGASYSAVAFGTTTFALAAAGDLSIAGASNLGSGSLTMNSGTNCSVSATSGTWNGNVTCTGTVSINRFKGGAITTTGDVTLGLVSFGSAAIAGPAAAVALTGGQWTGNIACTGVLTVDRPPGTATYNVGGISFPQPSAGDLRYNTVVGAITGTCHVPTASQTLSGIAVDNTTGNRTDADPTHVKTGDTFGANGNQFTGSFAGGATGVIGS